MKRDLLFAVLVDDDAFRATTLRQTLALAQRRRRARVGRRVLGGVSLLAIAFFLRPSVSVHTPPVNEPASFIVRSAPLAPLQRVRTSAQLFTPVVTTLTAIAVVTSEPHGFTVVETRTAAPNLNLLTDWQLLTAFPSGRPALIARGTPEARVVFY